MATTTGDESKQHVGDDARRVVEGMRTAVTGSAFVSLRHLLLVVVVLACVSLSPFPFGAIGVVAMGLLAFDMGRQRR